MTRPFTSTVPFMVVFELIAARCASTVDKASARALVSLMAAEKESPRTAFCSVIAVVPLDVDVKFWPNARSYVGVFVVPSPVIVFVANLNVPDLIVDESL